MQHCKANTKCNNGNESPHINEPDFHPTFWPVHNEALPANIMCMSLDCGRRESPGESNPQPSGCEAVVLTTTLPRHGYVCHKHFNHIDEAKLFQQLASCLFPLGVYKEKHLLPGRCGWVCLCLCYSLYPLFGWLVVNRAWLGMDW